MKDNKNIQKTIYISNKSIGLVVWEQSGQDKNILFASQSSANENELIFKLSQLLTNAANFLGFNIKDVEMVFDDPKMWKYEFVKQTYEECFSKEDVRKIISKRAIVDNYFINEIIFNDYAINDETKYVSAKVSALASNYNNYKKFLKVVKACNVKVSKSTNLYQYLNSSVNQNVVFIKKGIVTMCNYCNNKLIDIQTRKIDLNPIKKAISNQFKVNINLVDNMLNLINNYCDDYNELIVSNYFDLKNKKFNPILAKDVIDFYQKQLKTQIEWLANSNVLLISDENINKLANVELVSNDVIELSELSIENATAFTNCSFENARTSQISIENSVSINYSIRN